MMLCRFFVIMLIALIIITLLLVAELVFIILVFVKIKSILAKPKSPVSKEVGRKENEGKDSGDTIEAESVGAVDKQTEPGQKEDVPPVVSKKDQVLKALNLRKRGVTEEDLPEIKKELMRFFKDFPHEDYFNDIQSKDYFRFLDLI